MLGELIAGRSRRRILVIGGATLVALISGVMFVKIDRASPDADEHSTSVKIISGDSTVSRPRAVKQAGDALVPSKRRDALLAVVRTKYPALRGVKVACDDGRCTIEVTSRGLVDASEREALYGVVTGALEQELAQRGYSVGKRSTSVFANDVTVVILPVTVPG